MPYTVYRAHDITFNYLPMLTLAATSHPRPFLFTICTWSYLLVQTSTTCPSHVPAATSHPPSVLLTICTWSYLVVQTSSTWPSHAPAATSHPPSVLLTMCTWSYLVVQTSSTWPSHAPAATSHPPPVLLTIHEPGATWLYKLHLLVHSTPRQPPATIRLSCSQCTWSYLLVQTSPIPGHTTSLQPPAGCLNWGMWRR